MRAAVFGMEGDRDTMPNPLDEIIIEIAVIGSAQRVTALDPASLVEVVFQAPLSADRATITQLARQKLAYRLSRQQAAKPASPNRGGTLV
jgi:hypothetical protein